MEQEKLSNNKEIYHDTYPFDCHGNEMVYIFIYYIFFALQCTLHSLFTSKYSDPLNLAFSHQTVVVFSFYLLISEMSPLLGQNRMFRIFFCMQNHVLHNWNCH
jgi:hypothetical protein